MWVTISQKVLQLWGAIRHDPEALFEVRQLFFGLIIVAGSCYGAHALIVQPKESDLKKKEAHREQLAASLAGGELESMVQSQLQRLLAEQKKLTEGIGLLRFQEQLLREQYQRDNANEQFSKAIFTLLPYAPVDIEGEFMQMSVLDKRSFEQFDAYPVNIQGEATYSEFLSYLQYLEGSPEVGMISNLNLDQLPGQSFAQLTQVHFDLVLGRIQLR